MNNQDIKSISEAYIQIILESQINIIFEDREARKQDYLNKIAKGYLKNVTEHDVEMALDISEKYSLWLLVLLSKGAINFDDINTIKTLLGDFDKIKVSSKFTGSKDIFSYKTFEDFKNQILKSKETEVSKASQEKQFKETGQKVVAKEGPYEVIEITTPEASTVLCRGTSWCTKDPAFSTNYLLHGPLYLVKYNGEKYLLYSDRDGFNDVKDKYITYIDVPIYNIFKKLPLVKNLSKFADIPPTFDDEWLKNKYDNNYIRNIDGTIDIIGDVEISDMKLTKLPFKFGKISGSFYCIENQLQTLEGCPKYVGGKFNCSKNQLQTLDGCPEHVGGDFDCSKNQLQTLEGYPKYVGGKFYCTENQFQTLEGCPKYIDGDFYCGGGESKSKLQSLKGAPQKVNGNFICSYANLLSIKGAPEYIGGDFNCSGNQLQTLEGCPRHIGGDFDCNSGNLIVNQFQTLEGCPQHIGGSFYCGGGGSKSKLQSLKGAPQKVNGNFICSYANLLSIKGAPEYIGGNFNCSLNQLQTLDGCPRHIGGDFDCNSNQIRDLNGITQSEIFGYINLNQNKLKTLEGCPQKVGGGFYCDDNQLQTLKDIPKYIGGDCSITQQKPYISIKKLENILKRLNVVVKGRITANKNKS